MWYNQDLHTDLQERMEKMTADFDNDSFKALEQAMESESFKELEEHINDMFKELEEHINDMEIV